MDLPDLPGIAGDITFNIDDDFMIVPSRARTGTNSGISVTDTSSTPKVDPVPSQITENVEKPLIQKPPAPMTDATTEEYIIPPPPPASMNIPKPPPPPPPSTDMSIPAPPVSNARLNLLADIRKAGGKAKLRPAAASDRKPVNEKKKEKPPPTDDLMSDLRNRLQMRRKGISGTKDQNQPSDMMSKLSTMIPPPSIEQQQQRRNNESDDDWN